MKQTIFGRFVTFIYIYVLFSVILRREFFKRDSSDGRA